MRTHIFILALFFIASARTQIWEKLTKISAFPCNCHVGSIESKWDFSGPVYIGRRTLGDGSIKIGKAVKEFKKLYGVRESEYEDYEVYCGGKIKWVPKNTPLDQLVSSGIDANKNPTYVCRTVIQDDTYGQQIISGEYSITTSCCTISWIGNGRCVSDFTFMKSF